MTYSITKKGHSAHLCIISRQRPDLLPTTVKYAIQNLPNLRSIQLVLPHQSDANLAKYTQIVKKLCIATISTNPLEVTTLPGFQRLQVWNQAIKKIREKQIGRVVILWEGEYVLGKTLSRYWPGGIGSLLRISIGGVCCWRIREVSLLQDWHWNDPLMESPKLLINSRRASITKIHGDYQIVDSLHQVPELSVALNSPYKSPHYTFRRASQHLLTGNIEEARDLFYQRISDQIGFEVVSRCYLGLAVCDKIQGEKWESIQKNLETAFHKGLGQQLEPLYFLLRWSQELEETESAVKWLDTLGDIPLFNSTPSEGLLSYDEAVYQYEFILEYCRVYRKLGRYQHILPLLKHLLKLDIPIDANLKNEIINTGDMITHKLSRLKNYEESLAKTENQTIQVELQIQKPELINIKYQGVDYKECKKTLINVTGNERLVGSGIQFHILYPQDKSYKGKFKGKFQRGTSHKKQYKSLTERSTDHSVLKMQKFGLFSLGNIATEKIHLPPTPLLTWNWGKTIQELSCGIHKQIKIGIVDITSPATNKKYAELMKLIRTPSYTLRLDSTQLGQYPTIVLFGGQCRSTDTLSILLCFLFGCRVIYNGFCCVFQLLSPSVGEYLHNVSGWSNSQIAECINHLSPEVNSKQLQQIACQYIFPNQIYQGIRSLKWGQDSPKTIVLDKGMVSPYMLDYISGIDLTQSDLLDSISQLNTDSNLDPAQQKYLMVASGALTWSRLRMVKCLLQTNTERIDAIQILPWRDHIDGYFHNLKCLMGTNQWTFKTVTLFTWKYPLLVLSRGSFNSLCGYLAKGIDPTKHMNIVMV